MCHLRVINEARKYFRIDLCLFRSELVEGDLFLVRNIQKDKKIPGTKTQMKYLGLLKLKKSEAMLSNRVLKTIAPERILRT